MANNKKTITRDDYLRLVGLLTLARDHNRVLRDIEHSVAGLVGAEDDSSGGSSYYGHASDAVYSDYTADEMLGRLEITVEEA